MLKKKQEYCPNELSMILFISPCKFNFFGGLSVIKLH